MITGNYNIPRVADADGIIIPYQVITGNYNLEHWQNFITVIIPYQVITGNYNKVETSLFCRSIIPYQVITGNYNVAIIKHRRMKIIPYQVIMRKIRKVYWNYGKTVINLYTTTKNRKPCKSKFPVFNRRARDGTRTRGPDLGKVVLHQLSHSRIYEIVL